MNKDKQYFHALSQKSQQTKTVTLRMTEEEDKFLKSIKDDTGCSINLYLRLLIRERMNEY